LSIVIAYVLLLGFYQKELVYMGFLEYVANTCDSWFLMKGSTPPPLPWLGSIMGTSSSTCKFVYWVNKEFHVHSILANHMHILF
jgi:hypothetical protein